MIRIRARLISLGGVVLGGLFLILLVLLWIVTQAVERQPYLEAVFVLFLLGMVAYVLDAATESLVLQDEALVFDGLLTRRRVILFEEMQRVLLVHEGLNAEWGIETLTFERRSGGVYRLALGPLWRRRDLEALLARLEGCVREGKLVEEIR